MRKGKAPVTYLSGLFCASISDKTVVFFLHGVDLRGADNNVKFLIFSTCVSVS